MDFYKTPTVHFRITVAKGNFFYLFIFSKGNLVNLNACCNIGDALRDNILLIDSLIVGCIIPSLNKLYVYSPVATVIRNAQKSVLPSGSAKTYRQKLSPTGNISPDLQLRLCSRTGALELSMATGSS